MFWLKKELDYTIAIPNLKKALKDLTSKETKKFFDEYIELVPQRVAYLSAQVSDALKIDASKLNLSPESLILIWKWFLSIAQMERTPQRRLEELQKQYAEKPIAFQEYILNESKEQFSLQTEYILRDIGMYMGEVFVKNHPSIYWGYYEKPKTDFHVNTPLLLGFVDDSFTPPFKMAFEPIHMVSVQAANMWDKSQSEKDLFELYQRWTKYVPKPNGSLYNETMRGEKRTN